MTWLVLTHSHFSSIPSCRIPLSPLGVGWALWPTASGQLNGSRNVTVELREWKAQWGSDSPNLSFSGISRTAEAKCSSRCSYVHEWSLSTVVPGWGGRVDRDPAVPAWDMQQACGKSLSFLEAVTAAWGSLSRLSISISCITSAGPKLQRGKPKSKKPTRLAGDHTARVELNFEFKTSIY